VFDELILVGNTVYIHFGHTKGQYRNASAVDILTGEVTRISEEEWKAIKGKSLGAAIRGESLGAIVTLTYRAIKKGLHRPKKQVNVFIDGRGLENFSPAHLEEIHKLASRYKKKMKVLIYNFDGDKPAILNLPNITFTAEGAEQVLKKRFQKAPSIHLSRTMAPSEALDSIVGKNKFRYLSEAHGVLGLALLYVQAEENAARYGLGETDGFFTVVNTEVEKLVQKYEGTLYLKVSV